MSCTALFSVPAAAHQSSISQRSSFSSFKWSQTPSCPSKIIPLCSSTPLAQEEETSVIGDGFPLHPQSPATANDSASLRGCKACGREEMEKGCNGEGRIQGGIATVPGFVWWPIKAYRPCPGFIASGGRYRRQGQSMDEVAFGRSKRELSTQTNDESPSRKKKQGPRKFKR